MPHPNQAEATRNIQKYLRQLSYSNESISSPPIDGIFDAATENALREFQRYYGIRESGIADRITWNLLYSEYLKSLTEYSPPEALSVFPRTPVGYEVIKDDEFFLVSIIQFLLNEISIIYDSMPQLTVSGIYDDATANNVKIFQEKNRLFPSGNVDKATWDKLVAAYNNYASDYVK